MVSGGREIQRRYGDLLHTGENVAIRQTLGHTRLPQFVGSIDSNAPYRPVR